MGFTHYGEAFLINGLFWVKVEFSFSLRGTVNPSPHYFLATICAIIKKPQSNGFCDNLARVLNETRAPTINSGENEMS